ncbi:MAG: glycosyltransferase, partial [Candidatus Brocadiales bacterium]
MNPQSKMVSVIIPTLNEEGTIEATLRGVAEQKIQNKQALLSPYMVTDGQAGLFEIIVVDGGSQDRTREIA